MQVWSTSGDQGNGLNRSELAIKSLAKAQSSFLLVNFRVVRLWRLIMPSTARRSPQGKVLATEWCRAVRCSARHLVSLFDAALAAMWKTSHECVLKLENLPVRPWRKENRPKLISWVSPYSIHIHLLLISQVLCIAVEVPSGHLPKTLRGERPNKCSTS